ncbi:MAG: methylenetetrahydrofolate reductase [NAD(P)H] [Planctomycetes bacterium]|nr:methylenetetrahydrofolate reductase [NAD(P)H] [Planctomycetota bacterium]
MLTLRDIYATARPPVLSFEVFPPKTEKAEAALYEHLASLARKGPDFITCTYGAGGSTQAKTFEIVAEIFRRFGRPVASHLTCVGASAQQIAAYADRLAAAGIANVVALRGDPPKGEERFEKPEGGFSHADELVAFLRSRWPFSIAVGGYPETHREAPSPQADLANLKRKVDAGADVVITQLFFENHLFFRFRDRCVAAGIRAPIIPGILPPHSLAQLDRICPMCGASIPKALRYAILAAGDDPEAQRRAGAEHTARQVEDLLSRGVDGIHFYVLNRADSTVEVLDAVGR